MASTISAGGGRDIWTACNNCDRLWRVWYCIIVVITHIYLLYSAVQHRYLLFKQQAYDARYGNQWSEIPMNFYLAMIVLSAAMLPPFIYSSLFKVGNPVNDSAPFGRDSEEMNRNSLLKLTASSSNGMLGKGDGNGDDDNTTFSTSQKQKPLSQLFWARICRHLLPYSCFLHLVSAFALLFPLPVLHAEQIRNEALPAGEMWVSDLDFLLPRWELLFQSQMSASPRSLGSTVSPEIVNYALALAFLTVRLPNMFWLTSRLFTLIFSFTIFATSLQLIFEIAAASVLIKVGLSNILEKTFEPLFSPWISLGLVAGCFLLTLLACIFVYEYGHGQFLRGVESYRQCYVPSVSYSAGGSMGSQATHDGPSQCNTSWPCLLLLATNCLLMGVRVPLLCQFLHLRQYVPENKSTILLLAFVVSVAVSVLWFLLWFAFAIKTHWEFIITAPMPRLPSTSDSKQPLLSPAEPVYGCFHDAAAPSHSSNSSNAEHVQHSQINPIRLQMDCYSESSRASSTNPRLGMGNFVLGNNGLSGIGGNYVYLHNPNVPLISSISEHVDLSATLTNTNPLLQSNGGNPAFIKTSNSQGSLRGITETQYATLASLRAAAGDGSNIPLTGITPFVTSQGSDLDSSGDLLDGGGSNGGGSDILPRSNKLRSGSTSGMVGGNRNRVTFKDGYGAQEGATNGFPIVSGSPMPEEYEDYRVFRNMFNPGAPGLNNNGNIIPMNPTGNYSDIYSGINKITSEMHHSSHHPLSSSSVSGAGSSTMDNMGPSGHHIILNGNSAGTSPADDMLDDRLCSQV